MGSVEDSQADGMKAAPIIIQQDIPITYVNSTSIPDANFKVVIFTKSGHIGDETVTAWKVLEPGQKEANFVYSAMQLEVAALHSGGGSVTLRAGPFSATLGNTWAIEQQSAKSTPLLSKLIDGGNGVTPDTIVVKNIKPDGFLGKRYNIQLLKDGSPRIIQPNVEGDSQANLQLTPTLYFGIVTNVKQGAIFNSLTDSQSNTPFQLADYPKGLKVTLLYNANNGEYVFTGAAAILAPDAANAPDAAKASDGS
eukprot:TRINITY_DN1082_c0_g2_i1.p1 TRINITY_DN1082_c0_g2~~TRINITY_DN1082_c0_g2_i1.p1  ORF type:complete len:252 (+),score=53.25 TRINITY_DN1082_c0_g2_i1:583-1338(+)